MQANDEACGKMKVLKLLLSKWYVCAGVTNGINVDRQSKWIEGQRTGRQAAANSGTGNERLGC